MSESIIESDLKKTITWQFDQSNNLVGLIMMLAQFGKQSTDGLWEDIIGGFNLTLDAEGNPQCTELALSLIGRLLDSPRPTLTYTNNNKNTTTQLMSFELYRRLLLGKWRLFNSNGSAKAYKEYLEFVFKGFVYVQIYYQYIISPRFKSSSSPTSEEIELKAAFDQFPILMIPTPAGYGLAYSLWSNALQTNWTIGFSDQQDSTTQFGLKSVSYFDLHIIGTPGYVIPANSYVLIYSTNKFILQEDVTIPESGEVDCRFFLTPGSYVNVISSGQALTIYLEDGTVLYQSSYTEGSGDIKYAILRGRSLLEQRISGFGNDPRFYFNPNNTEDIY